ncbi:DUF5667 domain-containing protein [Ectobacillus sp. sgz5001026]|uniref:DUF5667 domain-containing protein n=1 Tax=Ectobacillus sp. sgz5001026 TaxID=3242473 RepID=UPI0036D3CFF6
MNKLIKSAMTTFIAGSMMMTGTAAFAASNDTTVAPQVAQPNLVEGDFFYFVKTTVEQIRLALATNDLDKAKLLSEQAAERIAEANVLNEKGNDTLTQDTLQKAADSIEKSEKLTGEDTATQPATTQPATTQPATTQPATTQPATTQPATTQPATTQPATTQPATTQPATTQSTTTPVTKESKEQEKKKEVQVHIGHNIEALAAVLDKVKNPQAKEAIAKNIEKSFTKLAAKIEKLKETQTAQQTENTNLQVVGETQAAPATNTAVTNTNGAQTTTNEAGENVTNPASEQHPEVAATQNGSIQQPVTHEQEHTATSAPTQKVENEQNNHKEDKKVEKKQEKVENEKDNQKKNNEKDR